MKMIIDKILDRKCGDAYSPSDFYRSMLNYMDQGGEEISRAMDGGENEDVQNALCRYIDENEYNPEIKKYIRSENWI